MCYIAISAYSLCVLSNVVNIFHSPPEEIVIIFQHEFKYHFLCGCNEQLEMMEPLYVLGSMYTIPHLMLSLFKKKKFCPS